MNEVPLRTKVMLGSSLFAVLVAVGLSVAGWALVTSSATSDCVFVGMAADGRPSYDCTESVDETSMIMGLTSFAGAVILLAFVVGWHVWARIPAIRTQEPRGEVSG